MRSIGLIKNASPCYHNDKEVALMIDPVLVGSVIRGLREKKGKTQEVVSGLAGLDRTHYSKIERGLRSPTPSVSKEEKPGVSATTAPLESRKSST